MRSRLPFFNITKFDLPQRRECGPSLPQGGEGGGGGVRHFLGPYSKFCPLKVAFIKFLFAQGSTFKFLSILGNNFFICSP